eukprot:4473284-Amphidinium_carterae.1
MFLANSQDPSSNYYLFKTHSKKGNLGIEPKTSRTPSENHTTRPNSQMHEEEASVIIICDLGKASHFCSLHHILLKSMFSRPNACITSALHRMRNDKRISMSDSTLIQHFRDEVNLQNQPWQYQVAALSKVLWFNPLGQLEDCVQSLRLKSSEFKTLRLKIAEGLSAPKT